MEELEQFNIVLDASLDEVEEDKSKNPVGVTFLPIEMHSVVNEVIKSRRSDQGVSSGGFN